MAAAAKIYTRAEQDQIVAQAVRGHRRSLFLILNSILNGDTLPANDFGPAGVATASRALVLDANKAVDTLKLTGNMKFSATNAITAFATGGQASATAITTDFARITTVATAGDSVKLPAAVAGMEICVVNAGLLGADVFPFLGDAINNLAVNLAVRQRAGSEVYFNCHVTGTWSAQLQLPDAQFVLNATVGVTTAAAGDMTGARYVQAGYSGVGAANLTTRTAAQMIADGFLQVGDSYVLEITNTSGGTTTLVGGTGVTLTGTMTMATNTTRRFNVKVTGAATITIQSTGVGTIS